MDEIFISLHQLIHNISDSKAFSLSYTPASTLFIEIIKPSFKINHRLSIHIEIVESRQVWLPIWLLSYNGRSFKAFNQHNTPSNQ